MIKISIELYPHNQETYNKIQEMWKTTNRVAAIQATGTGKSFLILKCLFDLLDKKKVVLAPTEYIFEQLIKNSKIEKIPNTEFITYAKIANMTTEEIKLLNPSLIVLDEFHRCGAEQWGKGVQNLLNIFPEVKVLGTSATPIRYLDNERDMSDELFDSNTAVNLSLAEAIVKEILPMPKYISALYTFDEEIINLKNKIISSQNSEEEKKKLLNKIELMRNKLNKSKGIPVILQKYLTIDYNKFIVFCKNKEHLNEMKSIVINWFKKTSLYNEIETYIVYSGYKNMDIEFEMFKNNKNNSLKLLFVIDMLNEGIHIEDISGVILLRPTVSPIIYYQQIGRAIDAGNNQILIFDFVNNFENIGAKNFIKDLKDSREKEIRERKENRESETIPEFIIYDEIHEIKELFKNIEDKLIGDWDFMYNKLKQYFDKNGHFNITRCVDKSLNYWITTQRINYHKDLLSDDKILKLNELKFPWDSIEEKWNDMYSLLIEYKNEFGDYLIPVRYIYKNKNLGLWVNSQRIKYKENKLSINKIAKLQIIGFIFKNENQKKDTWDTMYEKLKYLFNINGHCRVPQKDKKLNSWLSRQRKSYKNNLLKEDQIRKLEELNIIWDYKEYIKDKWNYKWNYMYDLLVKYKNEFGNCQVGYHYIYYDEDLGTWIRNQRISFKENKLSIDRINKLNNINFDFTIVSRQQKWEEIFNRLVEYLKINNSFIIPKDFKTPEEINLSIWCNTQKLEFNKGKLSNERIEKLTNIGFFTNFKNVSNI